MFVLIPNKYFLNKAAEFTVYSKAQDAIVDFDDPFDLVAKEKANQEAKWVMEVFAKYCQPTYPSPDSIRRQLVIKKSDYYP